MDTKTLASLKPTGNTSADIEAAIQRAAAARIEAERRAKDAATELEAGAMTLTSSQRRNVRDALEDAAADAKQIEAIAETLAEALANAIEAERRIAADKRHADLTARLVAHEARWNAEYPAAAAVIAPLMAERVALYNDLQGQSAINASVLQDALNEVRLLKTPAERAYDLVPESTRRLLAEKERQEAAAIARGPRVIRFDNPEPIVSQARHSGGATITIG